MNKTIKRVFLIYCVLALLITFAVPTLAADDPLAVVNKMGDFIYDLIRAIGFILLGLGVVQLGLSFKSHDPQQRANGLLTLSGGLIIMFAREIIQFVTGA